MQSHRYQEVLKMRMNYVYIYFHTTEKGTINM